MRAMVTTGTLSENETKNANTEELFRKYGPMVLRRCRRILGDSCDATDAAQEVFVKALESKNALSAGVSSSLLWSIATNHCLNILRDKARRGGNFDGELLLEEIVCTEDMEARISCRSILRNLFSRHPQSSRTIAYLHLIDGMTLEETARMVNMSVSGVRKRLTALRETLGEMEGI